MEPRDWHAEPLASLGLSVRPYNCLQGRGIQTIGQLCCIPIDELLSGQSWGETTLVEARTKLALLGLRLRDDWLEEPIDALDLSPRAGSLMRELRLTTVGELLALSSGDLFRLSFREAAVRGLYRALGERGLRLRDGWPRGPQDWSEQTNPGAPGDATGR